MNGRPADWDDARLEAAFTARASGDRLTPPDLVGSVRMRLDRVTHREPHRLRRLALGMGLAAAVFVAAVVTVGQFGRSDPSTPASPGASRLAIPPSPATTAPAPFDAEIIEDLLTHSMTVGEALDRRDRALDDSEIAIQGFGWTFNGVLDCAVAETGPPFLTSCVNGITWLAPTNETRTEQGFIRPVGAGLNLAIQPETIGRIATSPTPIIVLGHFGDRRAGTCPGNLVEACRKTFVVDAVVSPADPRLDLQPREPDPAARPLSQRDVALGWMGLSPADPRLVAAFAVRASGIRDVEPVAVGAVPFSGVDTVWVARWVQKTTDGRPVLWTRLVADQAPGGEAPRAYDIRADGLVPVPRLGDPIPTPLLPTPEPTVNVHFPETWGGLRVQSVAEAIAGSTRIDDSQLEAVAIRGWYVLPDPTFACPEPDNVPVGPVEQPCPMGRHWVLDAPEQLWDDAGPPWIDRQPTGPALNPIVPADVPFDIPNLWFDTGPSPLPVVVIGHFRDPRTAFGGEPNDFVVDALVWRAGAATANVPVGRVEGALDDPLAVMIRVQRDAGSSIDAWLSLITGVALVEDDPAGDPLPPELATAERVWVVRRLVERQEGGVAIERAYTADGSDRVWSSSLCCMVWLETRLLTALGGPPILETLDYPGDILDVRPGLPDGAASWIEGQGPPETGTVMLGVIEGRPNELRIAWIGTECDRTWQLTWRANEVILWPRERQLTCSEAGVRREVVLTLDHPVDLEAISVSNGGTGG